MEKENFFKQTTIHATKQILIKKLVVSEMKNNIFLLSHLNGCKILVDAADECEKILELIEFDAAKKNLDLIITTHSHWDHIRALPELVKKTAAKTAAGVADIPNIPVKINYSIQHETVLRIKDVELKFIALRGHTPGSIAILYEEKGFPPYLFSGDSLFPGGVGNTFGDTKKFQQLLADVTQRIFKILPDETVILPGHGPETTLGQQRPQLENWKIRGW